jgi:acetyl esterase/lipase
MTVSIFATFRISTAAALLIGALPAAYVQRALAQDASTYYTVMHPEQFKTDWTGFYRQADAKTALVRSQLRHELNIPYGADTKQRLDIYFPEKMPAKAPVFLFLHGGGFREGDRAQYGFVAKPFAEHGVISVIASYRLTGGGFRYPAQRDDARLAVLWLYRNIARYGGDPRRIYISGHSSGAILVADLGVDRAWLVRAGVPKQLVRAIIPISGPYDLRTAANPIEPNVFWSGYTPTAESRTQASPGLHILDPVPTALVVAGSTENEGYDDYVGSSEAFVAALAAHGARAQFLSLPGAGHGDTVWALGDEHSELFLAVLRLISRSPEN